MGKKIDKVETWVDKRLKISPKRPFDFITDDGELIPTDFETNMDIYHSAPCRKVIIDEIFRHMRVFSGDLEYGRLRGRFLSPLLSRHNYLGLASARIITFRSETIGVPGFSGWMDGYLFEPGNNWSYGLTLESEGALIDRIHDRWERGELEEGANLDWGILVPGDGLTPENVEEGVMRWYRAKFLWKHGHWTHGGKYSPDFKFEIAWDELPKDLSEEEKENSRKFFRLSQGVR